MSGTLDKRLSSLGPDGLPAPGGPADRPHGARGARGLPLTVLLVLIGLFFLACTFSAGLFDFADRQFDFDRLAAAALGALFLYVAWVTRDLGRIRERLLDLMEEVLKIFYGPNFRREREAIDILVRALDSDSGEVRQSSRQHLVRLTGQDLGEDGTAWAEWWSDHRSTFRSPDLGAKET